MSARLTGMDPLWALVEDETRVHARAGARAAADEGVRRRTRGGCAPQFLKSGDPATAGHSKRRRAGRPSDFDLELFALHHRPGEAGQEFGDLFQVPQADDFHRGAQAAVGEAVKQKMGNGRPHPDFAGSLARQPLPSHILLYMISTFIHDHRRQFSQADPLGSEEDTGLNDRCLEFAAGPNGEFELSSD